MLLRESSTSENGAAQVTAVTSEDGLGSGVPHGDILTQLVNATLGDNLSELERARQAVVDELGIDGLIDAAGIIATFTMQNRVADATGLPLDAPMELGSRGFREDLGVNQFQAASYIKRGGWGRAILSKIIEPLLPTMMRLMARRKKPTP